MDISRCDVITIPDNLYKSLVKRVRVDDAWIKTQLVDQGTLNDGSKLKIRVYSIKFSGNQQEYVGLIDTIVEKIPDFVLSQKEINQLKASGKNPFIRAKNFFGDVDPEKDGRYGEFILFLMVETILKCPMIAHKIILYNPNDQVKGSDGLFFGEYGDSYALLIGEAKIENDRSKPIKRALSSIDRFYKSESGGMDQFHELIVAKKGISEDFSQEELDSLYKIMDQQSSEYKSTIKVHPILIIYDDKGVNNIEIEAKNVVESEQKMAILTKKLMLELVEKIKTEINSNHKELLKVNLDFFFIPTSDVAKLKHAFYKAIHGVKYKK